MYIFGKILVPFMNVCIYIGCSDRPSKESTIMKMIPVLLINHQSHHACVTKITHFQIPNAWNEIGIFWLILETSVHLRPGA